MKKHTNAITASIKAPDTEAMIITMRSTPLSFGGDGAGDAGGADGVSGIGGVSGGGGL